MNYPLINTKPNHSFYQSFKKVSSICLLIFLCLLATQTLAQPEQRSGILIEPILAEIRASENMIKLDQRYYKQAEETLRLIILAQFAYYQRDLQGALEFVNKSLKLFETTEGYALKGSLQYLLGNKAGAQKSWEKATEFSPEFLIPDTDILDQIINSELQN